jgi:hypothetical protein
MVQRGPKDDAWVSGGGRFLLPISSRQIDESISIADYYFFLPLAK